MQMTFVDQHSSIRQSASETAASMLSKVNGQGKEDLKYITLTCFEGKTTSLLAEIIKRDFLAKKCIDFIKKYN